MIGVNQNLLGFTFLFIIAVSAFLGWVGGLEEGYKRGRRAHKDQREETDRINAQNRLREIRA